MKNIKLKFLKNIGLGLFILGLTACSSDFLELNPDDQLSQSTAIVDLKSLEAATNGAYDLLSSTSYYTRDFVMIPIIMGDDTFISLKNSGRFVNFDNYQVLSEEGSVSNVWFNCLSTVNNINIAIERGSQIEFPASEVDDANNLLGQLYALRALVFFDLTRMFGKPYNADGGPASLAFPIILTEQTEIIAPPRNTVQEAYNQIISDFDKSLTLLDNQNGLGKIDSWAAKALLSRVYLYMEDWAKAESLATDVISNSGAALVDNANYMTMWVTDNSSESLFEINRTGLDYSTNSMGYLIDQSGYGDVLATDELFNLIDVNDVRKNLIEVGVRRDGENPANLIKKYTTARSTGDDQYNPIVIRLSEVILNRAEANFHLNRIPNAQADLNAIAQRGNPAVANSTLTGTALLDAIKTERRIELMFEGPRLFDLVRWKDDFTKFQTGDSFAKTYYDNNFIMPIPRAEMDANSNMVQNPGYN